jgi:5'-deoxynucleotidase YfbR-like HD superfamily hydrolase
MEFNKHILFLIEQAGLLMQMPRTHVRNLINSFDTVASHSHHVSVIAYCVARMEGLNHDDATKALTIGCFHDLAEGRTTDLDFVSKNYTNDNEEKAIKDQFKDITFGPDLEKILKEYSDRKTLVSKCAKDADQLAQIYHEWVLMWQGNKLAQNWFEADFITRLPHLYTESAKQLMLAMKDSNPHEWWWNEFVEKDGQPKNKKHLLGKNFTNE